MLVAGAMRLNLQLTLSWTMRTKNLSHIGMVTLLLGELGLGPWEVLGFRWQPEVTLVNVTTCAVDMAHHHSTMSTTGSRAQKLGIITEGLQVLVNHSYLMDMVKYDSKLPAILNTSAGALGGDVPPAF